MKKIVILLSILSLTILNSCERTSSNLVNMFYELTQCNDPWQSGANEAELRTNISNFLRENRVVVLSIRIENSNPPADASCTACNCTTGKRAVITISISDQNRAFAQGFRNFR